MKLDNGWDGVYIDKVYFPMQPNNFTILRPPTHWYYRWLTTEKNRIEQREIDRRWNRWNNTFKRNILFKTYNLVRRFIK